MKPAPIYNRKPSKRPHSNLVTYKILFVGAELSFSNATLGLVEAEFASIEAVHVLSLQEFCDADETSFGSLKAALVDESLVEDLIDNFPMLLKKWPDTIIGLAYNNSKIAKYILSKQLTDDKLSKLVLLPMNLRIDCWLSLLKLLLCGEKVVQRELLNQSSFLYEANANDPRLDDESEVLSVLTDREAQILKMVAEGKQNKIIAEELKLSEHTVKLHIHHVIAKLGVSNRTEAAVLFLNDRGKSQ